MAATFSHREEKLLSEMLWMAIRNGNRAETEAFDPTPEQYRMICGMANRVDASIEQFEKLYGAE